MLRSLRKNSSILLTAKTNRGSEPIDLENVWLLSLQSLQSLQSCICGSSCTFSARHHINKKRSEWTQLVISVELHYKTRTKARVLYRALHTVAYRICTMLAALYEMSTCMVSSFRYKPNAGAEREPMSKFGHGIRCSYH